MGRLKSLSRLPSLDGWRAVSIAIVLGAHTTFTSGFPEKLWPLFHWGFDGNLGVRCFFLISGFLITWLMLREASRHLSAAFIERLEAKHALVRQASQDFLTGLPNRAAFLSALRTVQGSIAIVAIDLDGFKPVNDRHGHHAGDDLLRQVAERLAQCIGAEGIAARFGGDEFMLLKQVESGNAGRASALALAKEAVMSLSMPFLLSDVPVVIGASAGILVTEHMRSPSEDTASLLLEQADRALYAAKRAGGGRWQWSDEPATGHLQAS